MLFIYELVYFYNRKKTESVPTFTEYFSPDVIVERNKFNNYSRLVCDQFNSLINEDQHSMIDTVTSSLKPIKSEEIMYPERKSAARLITEFILTLKEKNLLPCIVFTDNRTLCEKMASSVAEYFENLEKNLRQTKYKNQIELLKDRLEQLDKSKKKVKEKKMSKSSKKGHTDVDDLVELKILEEEKTNQIVLSGFEQKLLNGILDEGTLANRQGCDQGLVDTLLERASSDNGTLVQYMRRGIAYHHAGLNNKGRVAVEALFRNRYVQVIFSTATLGMIF